MSRKRGSIGPIWKSENSKEEEGAYHISEIHTFAEHVTGDLSLRRGDQKTLQHRREGSHHTLERMETQLISWVPCHKSRTLPVVPTVMLLC